MATGSRHELSTDAIVVAAGSGTRLGCATPKLFVDLAGRPLVFYALSVLQQSNVIRRVVLVVPEGAESEVEKAVLRRFSLDKVERTVPGGGTRGDSVYNGLVAMPESAGTVLIHDGARPFVTEDLVLRVAKAAARFGAAVPGLESADTLKRVENEIAVATLDRSRIQRIQTPQGFHRGLILEAYERARKEAEIASDDATLVEHMGVGVHVVPGAQYNFKITTLEDLRLAEAVISSKLPREGTRE